MKKESFEQREIFGGLDILFDLIGFVVVAVVFLFLWVWERLTSAPHSSSFFSRLCKRGEKTVQFVYSAAEAIVDLFSFTLYYAFSILEGGD